ncbi:MAG: DUF2298 domain-containing protein, partial [Candidatus Roizmanbacteria bacterium]|nr:DUF2298 domain-containing protein [Candidatus Roizmanbacteria bacterium]
MSAYQGTVLPPIDMWYAGKVINYYYFGHYLTALLSKAAGISPVISYNLMLATIVAVSVTATYSLGSNLYQLLLQKSNRTLAAASGILSSFILNFGGNLHTVYLFTKGYSDDNPVPFWQILSSFNPTQYWYPRATRFIPFTIHEFPSYSHIVADLHGHVVNIMHVLLIYALFLALLAPPSKNHAERKVILFFLGLFLAISYMTNATDLLVYSALAFLVLTVTYINLKAVLIRFIPLLLGTVLLIIPFASRFIQFSNSIGINCAPAFLINKPMGLFIAEPDKCQTSPFWMLAILWGFFWWVGSIFFIWHFFKKAIATHTNYRYFIFFTFTFSIILTLIAEFFYFKDIYPNHFRANTMFKLGYQAYMLMAIASGPIIVSFIHSIKSRFTVVSTITAFILIIMLCFVGIFSLYGIPAYYGSLGKFKTLDGSAWTTTSHPYTAQVITLLRSKIAQQGTTSGALLEAHGDSYTDFNMVSSFTGAPTVVGWAVHEWLWRKDYSTAVAPRAADVNTLYTSDDLPTIRKLLKKYHIRYVLISPQEYEKYPTLQVDVWYKLGRLLYEGGTSGLETNYVPKNYKPGDPIYTPAESHFKTYLFEINR